jgi:hypothetical protein
MNSTGFTLGTSWHGLALSPQDVRPLDDATDDGVCKRERRAIDDVRRRAIDDVRRRAIADSNATENGNASCYNRQGAQQLGPADHVPPSSAYSVEQTTTMRRTVGSMRPMPCLRHENPLLVGSSVADGTTAADRRAPSKARLAIDGSRKA